MNFIESLHERFIYKDGKLLYRTVPIAQPYLRGKEAGSIFSNGYRIVTIGKKRYPASHIVWAMHNGEMPLGQIDHKNHNPLDNRIENLRHCTRAENQRYRRMQSNNTSGYKGVKKSNMISRPWRAYIRYNHKLIDLGSYVEKIDAAIAYNEAAQKYHGEFAVLNNVKRAGL